MTCLTGLNLLHHHQLNQGLPPEDKVIRAGYVVDGKAKFTAYYSALIPVLNWNKAKMLTSDRGGSKIIQTLLNHAESRREYKNRNDKVTVTRDKVIISYYDTRLVTIDYEDKFLEVGIFHNYQKTKSTKERLNRILMRFCGCQLYQHKKVWYVHAAKNGRDILFDNFMQIPFLGDYQE
jgi:hypothetical protein